MWCENKEILYRLTCKMQCNYLLDLIPYVQPATSKEYFVIAEKDKIFRFFIMLYC